MATKEMNTILIATGTAFLCGGIMLIQSGKYVEASMLAIVGIAAFHLREITKEDSNN